MNGRIYDPTLGRFLQADPHIQAPSNSQSYNRYSYVLNNPLSYTDPSGYFFKALNKLLGKFAPFVSIAFSIWAPWGTGLWASIGTGFVAGGIATGSLKGALVGAFTAGMFHGIGTHFEGYGSLTTGLKAAKVLAHGIAGGISSVLSGGKFGHGFASAGFTQALSGSIDGIDRGSRFSASRIVAAAVVGGTASKVSGGKFANGAVTGAFSRAFNDEAHWNRTDQQAATASAMAYEMDGGLLKQLGFDYNPTDGFSASLLKSEDGYMLAFRGTEGLIDPDMLADIAQGGGITTSQYEQAVALATDVYQSLGGSVTFVGHSLGGGLAAAAANATGGQAITFNPAGLSSRYNTGTSGGITSHIIRGDILSSLQNGYGALALAMPNTVGTRVYHSAKNWYDTPLSRHSISQFSGR